MKAMLVLGDHKSSLQTQIEIGETFSDVHKYVNDRLGVPIDKERIIILDRIYSDNYAGIGAIVIVKDMGWICSLSDIPEDYRKEYKNIEEVIL